MGVACGGKGAAAELVPGLQAALGRREIAAPQPRLTVPVSWRPAECAGPRCGPSGPPTQVLTAHGGLALTLPAPITRLGAFLGVLTALVSKPVALRYSISQVLPSLEGEGTRACVGPPQPPMSLQGGLGRGAPPPSGGGPSDAL